MSNARPIAAARAVVAFTHFNQFVRRFTIPILLTLLDVTGLFLVVPFLYQSLAGAPLVHLALVILRLIAFVTLAHVWFHYLASHRER